MLRAIRKIAFKLAVLAGVPVIGAALVSARLATDTRDRARTADDVGSIEDLADLSTRMTATVDALQTERAAAALTRGLRGNENAYTPQQRQADGLLSAQEKKTDATVKAMDTFLLQRDLTRVSPRLRGDLDRARQGLQHLARERQEVASGAASIAEIVAFYGGLNEALIDATAALTRLSSDGDLLRALSSLVALMHVKECASREHAVLSHTFAAGEFAPGMYRSLVALTTEEAVHSATLRSFATARQREAFQRATEGAAAQRSAGMVKRALEATEDRSGVDANDWFGVQQSYVGDLANIQDQYARAVRQTARSKVEDAQQAIRYGATLVIGVIAVSLVLATAIGRGITRSVLLLVGVAGRVQREKDFSLRAQKSTNDEVGALTEAFNEMLGVIQERDQELTSHRQNLEHVVLDRTRELSQRSDDMRLVLDTVEQGLATIDRSGCLVAQRSRAFDLFFGVPGIGVPFYDHIAGRDAALSEALRLDWQRIVEDARSLDRTFSLAESRITIGESHFALAYKLIVGQGVVSGALLTVSDVTTETTAAMARARLERELQLSQKLEGVGQLAAGVAHEINTPMQYVGDNIAFLAKAFEKLAEHMKDASDALSPGGAASLGQAREFVDASSARLKLAYLAKNIPKALQDSSAGITHVSNIVRAMKSFAHVDGDEKTNGDLNQAIRDTLMVAQSEYKSCASVETHLGQLPSVLCFPGQLNQVFLNLIVNAAHAIADAKPDLGGKICVTSRAEGDAVAVTISDNGLGIPEHIQHKIFDLFFTTKPVGKGTGQGLSISRSIVVDAHGGTLSFETAPGLGTAFTVRLPVDGHTRLAS